MWFIIFRNWTKIGTFESICKAKHLFFYYDGSFCQKIMWEPTTCSFVCVCVSISYTFVCLFVWTHTTFVRTYKSQNVSEGNFLTHFSRNFLFDNNTGFMHGWHSTGVNTVVLLINSIINLIKTVHLKRSTIIAGNIRAEQKV